MKLSPQIIRALIGVTLVFGVNTASATTIISFQEGFDGYSGTLTAEISSGHPNSPSSGSGGSARISVDNGNGHLGVTQALVIFDGIFGQSGVPSSGVTINSASLQFLTKSSSPGDVNIYQMTTDWDNSVSWNSLGGNGLADDISTTADDVVSSLAYGALVTFDVTASVTNWAAGASNFGWGLINDSNDGWDFSTELYNGSSDWNMRRPLLTIDYTIAQIAEPGTAVLLGLGLLAIFIRRKARNK